MSGGEAQAMATEALAGLALPTATGPLRSRSSMLDASPPASRGASVIAGAGTVGVHIALVALAMSIGTSVARRAVEPAVTLIDVELPPPPTPAPVEEPPSSKPAPVRPRVRAPEATREAPPPAAAQAGQALTAAEEVVDFGDSFVAGKGESFAGGVTEAGGTAKNAVYDSRARAGGVEGGTGTDLLGDRSRAPRLAGGNEWEECPFPPEADDAGVDHAVVTLRVEVGADGTVASVRATSDPGHGFAREARRCAMSERWSAGLDRAGNPTSAVATVTVRFDR
jgi:outer membrane biosynthesis protein TonB